MSEIELTAGALYRAGKLTPAIEAANAAVRNDPADLSARVLLAELLIFAGNLDRADRILDAAAQIVGRLRRAEERVEAERVRVPDVDDRAGDWIA